MIIKSSEVASLLTIDECMTAVENAFKLRALGEAAPPGILGVHAKGGGFHMKAGILNLNRQYFVAKTNANFPENKNKFGLPTIQGIIIVSDASNGKVLALMDSIEITIIRTGAATGVAAKYLSRKNSKTVLICGCGNQGRISLHALKKVRDIETVYAYDIDDNASRKFASKVGDELGIEIRTIKDIETVLKQSDICVTCTPSKKYFIDRALISPGTFIAAVGSDSEEKHEIDPSLIANCKLVADSIDQCATIGELHHALQLGIVIKDNVYAELGDVIAGLRPGRESEDEIIIFDSTGTAIQDVAAASIVYEKAVEKGIGFSINFSE